jgi:hypothetical protein
MEQNRKPDDQPVDGRIDDGELVDDGPPLPGEGHGDPLMDGEPTALEDQVDPDTGLPVSRDALR